MVTIGGLVRVEIKFSNRCVASQFVVCTYMRPVFYFVVVLCKTYVLAFISCKRGNEYFVVLLHQTYLIE